MRTEHFKERLETEKTKLEANLAAVGRRNPATPDDWEPIPSERGGAADLADQADVTISRENNAAILADLEARYDTVLGALKRMASGAYGVCEECGKPIEEKRLEADPAATTCIQHR